MADWNPSLYLQYKTERSRPAAELLSRVALESVRSVVDLGCGPGNSTALLHQRWPTAKGTISVAGERQNFTGISAIVYCCQTQ